MTNNITNLYLNLESTVQSQPPAYEGKTVTEVVNETAQDLLANFDHVDMQIGDRKFSELRKKSANIIKTATAETIIFSMGGVSLLVMGVVFLVLNIGYVPVCIIAVSGILIGLIFIAKALADVSTEYSNVIKFEKNKEALKSRVASNDDEVSLGDVYKYQIFGQLPAETYKAYMVARHWKDSMSGTIVTEDALALREYQKVPKLDRAEEVNKLAEDLIANLRFKAA